VVQIKKKAVEQAIIAAALKLFSQKGYRLTKLSDIASSAEIGVGNIYSYFPSKVQILYAVYGPWLLKRLMELEARIEKQPSRRQRLRTLLIGLWREIPQENPGLANSLMEALATAEPGSGKQDNLIFDLEARISAMMADALPQDRAHLADNGLLANFVVMAYDGFVINRRIGDLRDVDAIVDDFCHLVFGAED
jgi:AcrR family transcriptional regulator